MPSPQRLANRISQLASALEQHLYERSHIIRLCLLAALTGESVFLLGPPGIGKSLLARRLKHAFHHARSFEYLMTRFSTPEELFGPLSIQALKQGRYQRLTRGYLPEAEIVFLDEIWKAGPAILNTLLTAINERLFRNGSDEITIPLHLLITASNELPEPDSGLEALYDRMLIRLSVEKIQQKSHFRALLTSHTPAENTLIPASLQISGEEYQQWQQQTATVRLPEPVFELLFILRQQLEQLPSLTSVSDRRWKKAVRLLQACAFFSGRQTIVPLDLVLLKECLWHSPAEIAPLAAKISEILTSLGWQQQSMLTQLNQIEQQHWQQYQQQADKQALTVSGKKIWWHSRRCYSLPDTLQQQNLLLLLEQPLIIHDQNVSHISIERQQLTHWLTHNGNICGKLNACGFDLPLDLQINNQRQLLIRDISLQSRRLLLPGTQRPKFSDEHQQQLTTLEQQWHQQHQLFSQQQPCLFIEDDWLARIENSLQEVLQQIKQARQC